jgi:hypothetical protein
LYCAAGQKRSFQRIATLLDAYPAYAPVAQRIAPSIIHHTHSLAHDESSKKSAGEGDFRI